MGGPKEPCVMRELGFPKQRSNFRGWLDISWPIMRGDSVAEWLACWTQAQKGPGSNRSHDAVG